ncbi:MAG TPA: hypothetical protein VGK56_05600, partial [Anaerolineales bacterium]
MPGRVPPIRPGGCSAHGGRSLNSNFLNEKDSKAAILYQDEWHDKQDMRAHMVKILVIDDDPKDRGLIATVLEERGYEVILAENGR